MASLLGTWSDAKFNLPAPWRQVFGRPSAEGVGHCLSPAAFFAFRCALALFWFAIFIWSIPDQTERTYLSNNQTERIAEPGAEWLIYLTNWSMLFELVYLVLAASLTGLTCGKTADAPEGQDTPWFARITFGLQTVTYTFSFIVATLFWALDFDGGNIDALSPFTHGVNFVIALADCLVAGIPMRLTQMWLTLAIALVYVIFTIIYDVAGGKAGPDPYIYEVLNWTDDAGEATLYACLVCLVAFPIVFGACVYGVMPSRAKCKCCAARMTPSDVEKPAEPSAMDST